MNTKILTAATLLKSFRLTTEERQAVFDFHVKHAFPLEGWLEGFYSWLQQEQSRNYGQFFPDGLSSEVQRRQVNYWREFLSLALDGDYVESRIQLGRVHARIGLPLRDYLAGMSFSQSWLAAHVTASSVPQVEKTSLIASLLKMCQLDSALVSDSYSEASILEQSKLVATHLAILNGSLDPMVTINRSGTIQFASESVRGVFGWNPNEIVGKNINILMPDPYHSEHDQYLENYKNTGIAKILGSPREVRARRKDGHEFDAEICVNTVNTLDEGTSFVGIIRDISDRKVKERIVLDFSNGKLTDSEALRGDQAPLSLAIVRLGERLGSIVRQAEDIALRKTTVDLELRGGQDALGKAVNEMNRVLRAESERERWLKNGQAILNGILRDEQDLRMFCRNLAAHLCRFFGARVGVFYVSTWLNASESTTPTLALAGAYAKPSSLPDGHMLQWGEGLLGQAAIDQQIVVLNDNQQSLLTVQTGTTEKVASHVLIIPLVYRNKTLGVLELGSGQAFTDVQVELMQLSVETLGAALHSAQERRKVELLLAETQKQSERLSAQKDALRSANATLSGQALNLEDQKLELSKTSQYKSEFLSNMSHELRTPLNSMLILSRSLADNRLGNLLPDQVQEAEVVHSGGQELLTLINEILDLSKIEAGRMEMHPTIVELGNLSDELQQQFRPLSDEKNLSLDFVLSDGLPFSIRTDEIRLRQILKNLLSNAIKFTKKGHVRVTFELGGVSEPLLVVRVKDTGIGIPQHRQEAIFEAFRQVDGSTSRTYGGTGLGLTISQRLARLLGGSLTVESGNESGSTFILTILAPLATANAPPPQQQLKLQLAAPSNSAQPDKLNSVMSLRGRKVLLVDDDSRSLFAMSKVLCDAGLLVDCAMNGKLAIEKLQSIENIELVLMDIMMPVMNGLEAIAHIRRSPELAKLPIIALTANALPEHQKECLAAGATRYASKPIATNELLSAIDALLPNPSEST